MRDSNELNTKQCFIEMSPDGRWLRVYVDGRLTVSFHREYALKHLIKGMLNECDIRLSEYIWQLDEADLISEVIKPVVGDFEAKLTDEIKKLNEIKPILDFEPDLNGTSFEESHVQAHNISRSLK